MKQFDEEYKAYARENAPDLWNRIEAGVDVKIQAASASGKGTKRRNGKKSMQRYIRFATSLAACLAALLLAVPVFRMVGRNHTKEMKQDAAAPQVADITIENAQEEALPEQETAMKVEELQQESESVAEECDEEAVIEIAYERDASEAESVSDRGESEAAVDEPEAEDGQQEASVLGNGGEKAMQEAENGDATPKNLLMEEQSENAYVKVLEKAQSEDGFVYTVEILEDNGKSLLATQIWYLSATENQVQMETDGTYHISLCGIETDGRKAVLFNIQNN